MDKSLDMLIVANNAEIAMLRAELARAREDTELLDWLERCRLALNKHYGTSYGWKVVRSANVNRVMCDLRELDLHDSEPNGPDIRTAIKAAREKS